MPYRIVEETPTEETPEAPVKGKFRIVSSDEEPKEKVALTKEEEIAKSFKFFGYQPEPETIEKIRHPLGVATKGLAKGLIGAPGDILSFAQGLMGIDHPMYKLPTSEDVGQIFETLSKEEFEPQNLPEEFAGRGAEFLGAILGLGGPLKGTTAAKSLGRTVLGAFAPAGASVTAEKVGLPPWAQVAATVGTSFLAHRLTGKGLKDIERGLYSQAREAAGDAEVSAKALDGNLNSIIKRLKKGGIEPSDKEALRKIKDIKASIKNGKLSIEDGMAIKRKINEARGQLFSKDLGKVGMKSAKRNLNDVSKSIDKALSTFDNQTFQESYRQANQLHAGQAETRKIFRFITQHPSLSGLGSVALKYLFPNILKPGAMVAGGAQIGNFIKALTKYPGYRKAYFDIFKGAAKEEVRATASALNKFNKKTEEIQKKEKFRIIQQDE